MYGQLLSAKFPIKWTSDVMQLLVCLYVFMQLFEHVKDVMCDSQNVIFSVWAPMQDLIYDLR